MVTFFTNKGKYTIFHKHKSKFQSIRMHTETNTWHLLHMTKMTMKGKGKQKLIAALVHNKPIIPRITNIEVTSAVVKC